MSNNSHGENETAASSISSSSAVSRGTNNRNRSADILERYGNWLISIPRDDAEVLQQTSEYQQFCSAFERLCHAHQRLRSRLYRNISEEGTTDRSVTSRSFLQHIVVDDVVLRIFEFLPCSVLCQVSSTCHR